MRIRNYFFIMGLPRSRTAWLSNWFTHELSICVHDASRFCDNSQGMKKVLHSGDAFRPDWFKRRWYYGSADSVNGWWYEGLNKQFPRARFALIERDFDEVSYSCERLFNENVDKELRALHNVHEHIKHNDNVYVVNYERLNHPAVMQGLHEWLTPQVPFDNARFELLNNLDITINPKKYFDARCV